ncbi:uncharacterized protein BO72DRAFT_213117 [Aspergillus fijiensis CBS 313.89]|uniref:Secreted protein n=1 Tax=Aspergillus fijiensis CBS 313.89 TaxID=1448319 RepID=A0A8G1RLX7_9EURO|nr:uncharacterized protein BO72DRAFT_213117 [Aspergillus fijiensis CBS 313.89]RAK74200.1 hypothetical protein BO72DRAFT_213117 [Aspergillus fijiensis CBS 313.89]
MSVRRLWFSCFRWLQWEVGSQCLLGEGAGVHHKIAIVFRRARSQLCPQARPAHYTLQSGTMSQSDNQQDNEKTTSADEVFYPHTPYGHSIILCRLGYQVRKDRPSDVLDCLGAGGLCGRGSLATVLDFSALHCTLVKVYFRSEG